MSALSRAIYACNNFYFSTDPPASSLAHLPLLHLPEDAQTQLLALPPASCPSQSSSSATVLPPPAGPPPPPTSTPSFVLSKASAPIPGKLVAKVQSLQFIEMRELLPDDIALLERLAALPNTSALSHGQRHTPQREVSSLLTWVCAFTTDIAIMAEMRPDLIKSRLAYMCNIVREASRFGGDGWKTYDYVFRSQAAVDPSMDWAELNPSMLMAFMAARPTSNTKPLCHLCQEADHSANSCALAPLAPTPSQGTSAKQPRRSTPSPDTQICISWNQGACMLPGSCRYKHTCGTCGDPHRAHDCSLTPPDYAHPGKQPGKQPGP